MQTRTQAIVAAVTAFAACVNGHIIMKSPAPFGSVGSTKLITSSPLTSANYPCQVGSNPAAFYSKDGLDNKMEIGKTQTISFEGSAVHGGGSCQLALTKDPQPSASTSWEVILSIEGGCPSKTGNGVDEYDFTIPDSIAAGDYVFAWTWISALSGTQEYYMNCAPVTITGGNSKRDESYYNETMELFSRDNALPELMVANLAEINDCKSQLSSDPVYPNPGPNVIKPGSNNKFAPISGTNCVPKGAKDVVIPGSGSSPSSSSSSGSATSSAAATSAASSAISSNTSGFITVTIATSSIQATTSSAAASSSSSAVVSSSSAAASSSSAAQTPITSPSASPASSAPASGPSGSPSGSGSSVQGLTGACTTEGMFNCIGGTFYQQCASGSWSTVMSMPATTKCAPGQTMTLWARDLKEDTPLMRRRGY
ncbi:hypothetical protein F5Y09DRAFT_338463 [Xylaria sp. FL1042]|nr:hypothetical protein F5Y09DRAFT_338463 [Xylaria sp. FL1042]